MKGSQYMWYRFHSRKFFYAIQHASIHGLKKGVPIGIYSFGILKFQEHLHSHISSASWLCATLLASAPLAFKLPLRQVFPVTLIGGSLLSALDYAKIHLELNKTEEK